MGGRAQSAALDLRQPEGRVLGGHDHVGVTHQADAATDAESVDRGDHRDRALVDRPEGGEAAAVGVDQRGESLGSLHFLDVHPGVEPAALGPQDHRMGVPVVAGGGQHLAEFEPAARWDGVDRGKVDGDRDYPRFDGA